MKAVFMTELGGKLVEIDRREVPTSDVYYCAKRDPVQLRVIAADTPDYGISRKERWVAIALPHGREGLAVFVFDCLE